MRFLFGLGMISIFAFSASAESPMAHSAYEIRNSAIRKTFNKPAFLAAIGHSTPDELLAIWTRYWSSGYGHEVWFLLTSPDRVTQQIALALQTRFACRALRRSKYDNPAFRDCKPSYSSDFKVRDNLVGLRKAFVELDTRKIVLTPEEIALAQNLVKTRLKSVETTHRLQGVRVAAPYLCLFYLKSAGCTVAVNQVITAVDPRSNDSDGTLVSFGALIESMVGDSRMVQGLMKAGTKILDRVLEAETTGEVHGNILDDLTESFVATGLAKEEAEDYAFDVLAVYSGRGAHMERLHNLYTSASRPIHAALLTLSAAINVLDTYGSETHYYSLPREQFETDAIHWKPYHFWMSAYLSRMLKQRGAGDSAAFIAPLIVGHLYELMAPFWDRVPHGPFMNPYASLANDAIRIDLVYQTAGARFGLNYAAPSGPALSLPENFDLMVQKGKRVDPLPEGEAKRFLADYPRQAFEWWNRIFATRALHRAMD